MREHYKTSQARTLRKTMTDAEKKLWHALRNRQFHDIKFRRQFPIGKYIADFASLEPPLVVELDGGQHAMQKNLDNVRSAFIKEQGFTVVRFWNNDVLSNLEAVLTMLERHVSFPHPNLLPQAGEGMRAAHG